MFAAYVATRWFAQLRSTAIFLLVYVLAVVTREAVVGFGCVFVRLAFWRELVTHGRVRVPWTVARASASGLVGFFLVAVLAPVLPLYVAGIAAFASYSLLPRRGSPFTAPCFFWRCAGATACDLLLTPLMDLRDIKAVARRTSCTPVVRVFSTVTVDDEENVSDIARDAQRCSREGSSGAHRDEKLQEDDTSSPSGVPTPVPGQAANALLPRFRRRLRRFLRLSSGRKAAQLFWLLAAFAVGIVVLYASTRMILTLAVELVVLSLLAFMSICALVMFVLISGGHVPIVLAIGLEIVMSLQGVELETLSQELKIWICFLIPLFIAMNKMFWEKLIEAALIAASRKSKLNSDFLAKDEAVVDYYELFKAIPLNAAEAAVKISDSSCERGTLPASRIVNWFVMSLDSGSTNDLRCYLLDKGLEQPQHLVNDYV